MAKSEIKKKGKRRKKREKKRTMAMMTQDANIMD
jgi:hypothetical protein